MFNKIVVFMTLILVLGGTLNSVDALNYSRQYCVNSTILYTEDSLYDADTGDLNHWNETFICDYGCYKGFCLPTYMDISGLSPALGLILVALLFIYAGLRLDKETHGVIQVLFLLVGLMFIMISTSIIAEMSLYSGIDSVEAAANSAFNLSIYVFWIVLFWFIILFFYKLLVMTGKIQPLNWSL